MFNPKRLKKNSKYSAFRIHNECFDINKLYNLFFSIIQAEL